MEQFHLQFIRQSIGLVNKCMSNCKPPTIHPLKQKTKRVKTKLRQISPFFLQNIWRQLNINDQISNETKLIFIVRQDNEVFNNEGHYNEKNLSELNFLNIVYCPIIRTTCYDLELHQCRFPQFSKLLRSFITQTLRTSQTQKP